MKKIVLLFMLIGVAASSIAQMKDPVQWNFKAVKKAEKVYEITCTAAIAKPWHIYSQTTPKGGPVPTKIQFKANPLVIVKGVTSEKGELKNVHDEYFGVDVKYFDNKVEFVQMLNLKSNVKTTLSGTVEFMVCNDSECLPPKKVPFDIELE
jgi:hypothetical protein